MTYSVSRTDPHPLLSPHSLHGVPKMRANILLITSLKPVSKSAHGTSQAKLNQDYKKTRCSQASVAFTMVAPYASLTTTSVAFVVQDSLLDSVSFM